MERKNQYVSDELFHFVGRHEPTPEKQFKLLTNILKTGTLRSSRQRIQSGDIDPQEKVISGELSKIAAICFCDIPRDSLNVHMRKYSEFGISFTKRFLASKGAKPVIYIPIKSKITKGKGNRGEQIPRRLRKLLNALIEIKDFRKNTGHDSVLNQQVTSLMYAAANEWNFLASEFYYFIKMYDEDLKQDHTKNYYMEREWRLVNEPTRTTLKFSLDDVNAVMVPKRFKTQLLNEFKSLDGRIKHPS